MSTADSRRDPLYKKLDDKLGVLFASLQAKHPGGIFKVQGLVYTSLQDALNRHARHFNRENIGCCKASFNEAVRKSLGQVANEIQPEKRANALTQNQVFTLIGLTSKLDCVVGGGEPCNWGPVLVPISVLRSALTDDPMTPKGEIETPGLQIVGPCEDGKPLHCVQSCAVMTDKGNYTISGVFTDLAPEQCLDVSAFPSVNKSGIHWGFFTDTELWEGGSGQAVSRLSNWRAMFLKDCLENVALKDGQHYSFSDGRLM